MATDISKLTLTARWQDLTTGMMIHAGGTSEGFNTGEWTSVKPHVKEEDCRQCLLCAQACPDSAIPVNKNERVKVDLKHCKGCGICAKVCPFDAIEMEGL
ncbi:MAG: 4Fe-4S binding protein [Anaerostipes sp.]|nr:4Fe-4S binding protein [Anaerostipes sp.]